MKPLDLARSSRAARLSQKMLDPVLAADRIKEHLHRRMIEPTGEDPAVIGQDLRRHPYRSRAPRRPSHTARVRSRVITVAHIHIRE